MLLIFRKILTVHINHINQASLIHKTEIERKHKNKYQQNEKKYM